MVFPSRSAVIGSFDRLERNSPSIPIANEGQLVHSIFLRVHRHVSCHDRLSLRVDEGSPACALGLTPFKAFILVSLPQAFRIALPGLINEFINLVKLTSLAYVISLREIMAIVNESIASSFRFVEWYMAALIYYLVIVSVLMLLQSYIQRRLSQK